MRKIISRDYPEANVEALIVLDGTTGQNALEQARQFGNVTELDGIIITKLDGTAKGGIAIAIQAELDIPVKFIGVGEKIGDLQRFNPEAYVSALFADFDEDRTELDMLIDSNIK
jgi:fused signal recognition particle receptor